MTEYIALLWLSDVVGSVAMLGLICVCAMIVGAILVGIESDAREKNLFPQCKTALVSLAVVVAIAGATPSKNTVYAIIAMKAGKDISQTEIGTKAHEALNAVLDKVIKEAKQ